MIQLTTAYLEVNKTPVAVSCCPGSLAEFIRSYNLNLQNTTNYIPLLNRGTPVGCGWLAGEVLFSSFSDDMAPVLTSLINIFLKRLICVILNNYHSSCRLIHEFET
jgi:hypothetical protein